MATDRANPTHWVPHISPLRCGIVATILLAATIQSQAQWQILPTPTTADLRGIHAVGNGVAWASGTNGTVLRTTDDGAHWQLCPTPPNAEPLDFRGIQAFDAQTAIVMSSGKGDLSRLYKTTDACQTWTLLFTNPEKDGFFDAIQADSREHAVVLGDSVASKLQMWQWNEGSDPEAELSYQDAHLAEAGESSFAASNSVLQLVSTSQVDPIWKYAMRWASGTSSHEYMTIMRHEKTKTCEPCRGDITRLSFPLKAKSSSAGIFSFSFRDDLTGIFVGGNYANPEATMDTAAFTIDGGMKWLPAQTPPHGFRSSAAYDPTTKTWITVGPNGTDISTDDGRNWRALKPTPADSPDADRDWNALSLPFVVGPHGRIGKLRPDALVAAPAAKGTKP